MVLKKKDSFFIFNESELNYICLSQRNILIYNSSLWLKFYHPNVAFGIMIHCGWETMVD